MDSRETIQYEPTAELRNIVQNKSESNKECRNLEHIHEYIHTSEEYYEERILLREREESPREDYHRRDSYMSRYTRINIMEISFYKEI